MNGGLNQWSSFSRLISISTLDILSYLQNELDYSGEEPTMSPRPPIQKQPQQAVQFGPSLMVSSDPSGQIAAQGARPEQCDQQPKNTVFSNALSSPIRWSLQNYHISQGGYYPNGNLPSEQELGATNPTFLSTRIAIPILRVPTIPQWTCTQIVTEILRYPRFKRSYSVVRKYLLRSLRRRHRV